VPVRGGSLHSLRTGPGFEALIYFATNRYRLAAGHFTHFEPDRGSKRVFVYISEIMTTSLHFTDFTTFHLFTYFTHLLHSFYLLTSLTFEPDRGSLTYFATNRYRFETGHFTHFEPDRGSKHLFTSQRTGTGSRRVTSLTSNRTGDRSGSLFTFRKLWKLFATNRYRFEAGHFTLNSLNSLTHSLSLTFHIRHFSFAIAPGIPMVSPVKFQTASVGRCTST
jgi:hypothetical protein